MFENRLKMRMIALGMMAATISAQAGTFKLHEFMNAQQLTAWRAQHAPPATTVALASDEQTQFFTGKPYEAASGTYQFKYRVYNPAIARWTSADPGGFPDVANCYQMCLNKPNQLMDTDGLMVANNTRNRTLWVKDERSDDVFPVLPGTCYPGQQDGFVDPANPNHVFKTVDYVDAYVNEDGSIQLSYPEDIPYITQ